MGHVKDLWTERGPSGRRVRSAKYGRGKRWLARWTSHGREHSRAFASKDAAEAYLARVAAGTVFVPKPNLPTVAEMLHRWQAAQVHHRASTAEATARHITRLEAVDLGGVELGRVRVDKLSRADVQQVVGALAVDYSPASVRVTYSALTGALRMAALDGLIPASPAVKIRLPKIDRPPVVPLTVEQVHAIIARMPGDYRPMAVLAAATGMRGGELRGLTWDRVKGRRVKIDRQLVGSKPPAWGPPKSKAGVRTLDMGQTARDVLDGLEHADDGLLFHTRFGTPIGRTAASEMWRAAVEGMGLEKGTGWHQMRHFHASVLIAAGLSARAVADRLGHADVAETLQTYAHLWPSDEERVVAVVDGALSVPSSSAAAVPKGGR